MKEPSPRNLIYPWLLNPPRWILWRFWLVGIACIEVLLLARGDWSPRHTASFAVFVVAVIVLHPIMNRRLPLFRLDVIRSWRTYAFIALLVIVNLFGQ